MSSAGIREKIDRVITAPDCICFESVRPPPVLWGDPTRCRHLPHKATSFPLLASAHWWKCSEARNPHLSQHSDTAKRCHNEFLNRMRFQNSKIYYKWNNKIIFSMTWFNNQEISVAPGYAGYRPGYRQSYQVCLTPLRTPPLLHPLFIRSSYSWRMSRQLNLGQSHAKS